MTNQRKSKSKVLRVLDEQIRLADEQVEAKRAELGQAQASLRVLVDVRISAEKALQRVPRAAKARKSVHDRATEILDNAAAVAIRKASEKHGRVAGVLVDDLAKSELP